MKKGYVLCMFGVSAHEATPPGEASQPESTTIAQRLGPPGFLCAASAQAIAEFY
jgi:hypothetical protein